jgi:hypothetical protein
MGQPPELPAIDNQEEIALIVKRAAEFYSSVPVLSKRAMAASAARERSYLAA